MLISKPGKVKNMSNNNKFLIELPPINGFVKQAELGGEGNDTQFEQAFSNLAHAYLKDKAPGLLDYEVGFELMERNEDNTKAVGLFGFKVGTQWLYAPVFFINGDLKGHELLYLKDQDQFVPLKENWLNYILRRKPASLGKKTDQNMSRLGFLTPDLQAFSRPPSKFASHTKQAFPPVNIKGNAKPSAAPNDPSSDQYPKAYGMTQPTRFKPDPAAIVAGWNGGRGGTGLEYRKDPKDPSKSTPGYNGGQGGTGTQGPRRPAPSPMQQPMRQQYPGNSGASMGVPAGYKAGSDDREEMLDGIGQLAKHACTNPELDPKYDNKLTLKSFLNKEAAHNKSSYRELVKGLIDICQQFPKMAEAIDKACGGTFIKDAVAKLSTLTEPGVLSEESVYLRPQEKKALTIIVRSFNSSDNGSDDIMDSSEADKQKLLTDGVIFRDARTKDDAAIAYRVQEPTSIENPPTTGIYDLLISPFSMLKTVIFLMPHGPSGRQDFATVVSYAGEKNWINSHPGNLFTRPPRDGGQDAPESKDSGDSYAKFFEKLPEISSLAKGSVYMAVSESGDASVPFEVLKVEGSSDGTKNYRVRYHDAASQPKPDYLPKVITKRSYDDCDMNSYGPRLIGGGRRLYVTEKPGVRIKAIKGDLYIPGSFKVIKLSGDCCSGDGSITPGNLTDLQHAIYQKTASLNVRHTGSEVAVNGRIMAPQDALIHLVRDASLREKQARTILEEAKQNKVVNYRVHLPTKEDAGDLIKSAAPGDPIDPSMQGSTSAPAFPTPPSGMESTLLGSVQSTYPQQQALPAMSSQSLQSNSAVYDPRLPDPNTMAVGYQAAQSGQKDVFDTSMIGTLIKSVRDDTMVDRHLGDLMGGLDKIGRILFSFYWHKDKFEDRYGKKDIPELEDNLRNSFEQLGDLLLFLKQKTIDSYPDEGISLDDNNV